MSGSLKSLVPDKGHIVISKDLRDKLNRLRASKKMSWEDFLKEVTGLTSDGANNSDVSVPEGDVVSSDKIPVPGLDSQGGIHIHPLKLSEQTKEDYTREFYEVMRKNLELQRKRIEREIEQHFGNENMEEEGEDMSKILEKVMEYQALEKAMANMNNKKGGDNMDMSQLLLFMLMQQQNQKPQTTVDPMMLMLMQQMQKEPPKDDFSKFLLQYLQNEVAGAREENKQLIRDMLSKQKEERQAEVQRQLIDQQASIFDAFKDEMRREFADFRRQQQQQLELIKQQNDFAERLQKTLEVIDTVKEFEEHAKQLGISRGLSEEEASKAVDEVGGNKLLLDLIQQGLQLLMNQTKRTSAPSQTVIPQPSSGSVPKPEPEVKPPKPIQIEE